MTDAQIAYMVDRFLIWKLPATISPDGGLSKRPGSDPVGTNLLSATEATEMVRHMIEGIPGGTAVEREA